MNFSSPIFIEQNLQIVAQRSSEIDQNNDDFKAVLLSYTEEDVDGWFATLNTAVSAQIDCTSCGNCCKTLMINVDEKEAVALHQHLNMSRTDFEDTYIEKSLSGKMLINAIPCHFLEHSKCNVYEHRFAGCKEFPGLQLPQVKARLFTIFMHYHRCPIIYSVIENMKIKLNHPTLH